MYEGAFHKLMYEYIIKAQNRHIFFKLYFLELKFIHTMNKNGNSIVSRAKNCIVGGM